MKNLVIVGDGLYVIDGEREEMPLMAKVAYAELIEGGSKNCWYAKAAAILISFSLGQKGWCGVDWKKLVLPAIRANCKDEWECKEVKKVFEEMIRSKLSRVHKHFTRRGFRWLNMFEPKIVFATSLLIQQINDRKNMGKAIHKTHSQELGTCPTCKGQLKLFGPERELFCPTCVAAGQKA